MTAVPSMRMVVSLADLDDSTWVNLTGASGHAFDAHYTDQTELWAAGETLPWPFTRQAVTDAEDDRLVAFFCGDDRDRCVPEGADEEIVGPDIEGALPVPGCVATADCRRERADHALRDAVPPSAARTRC